MTQQKYKVELLDAFQTLKTLIRVTPQKKVAMTLSCEEWRMTYLWIALPLHAGRGSTKLAYYKRVTSIL